MSEGKRNRLRGDTPDDAQSAVESVQQAKGSVDDVSESRRRFTKAGLLATPVLMSVASRPVLGGGGINCLSNALSGNLSHPGRGLCQLAEFIDWTDANNWPPPAMATVMGCGGTGSVTVKPDSFNSGNFPSSCSDCLTGQNPPEWIPTKCSNGTLFTEVFCTTNDSTYDEWSMYRILCQAADSDEAATVKALLYSLTYADYALRPMQVQDLWAGQGEGGAYAAFLSHFGGLKGYLEETW